MLMCCCVSLVSLFVEICILYIIIIVCFLMKNNIKKNIPLLQDILVYGNQYQVFYLLTSNQLIIPKKKYEVRLHGHIKSSFILKHRHGERQMLSRWRTPQ